MPMSLVGCASLFPNADYTINHRLSDRPDVPTPSDLAGMENGSIGLVYPLKVA